MIQLGGLQSAAVRGEQEWCIAHLLQRLTAEAVDHLAHQEALRRHVHDGETGIDAADYPLCRQRIGAVPHEPRAAVAGDVLHDDRSEEHTPELHSLMRTQYAVFCLNKNTKI